MDWYLMLGPQAFDLEALSQLVETPMEVATELHQVLDVVDVREVHLRAANSITLLTAPAIPPFLPGFDTAQMVLCHDLAPRAEILF